MSIIPFPTARMLPGIKPLDSAAPAAPRAIVSDLSAILARAEPPAPAPQPAAHATLPPLTIIARGVKALKKLSAFIGKSQAATVRDALRGEEGQWFMEKMEELAARIEGMPVTYGQDGKGDDAICYLHYFKGSYDGYITEKDMEEPEDPAEAQWQAHGYVHWAQNPGHLSMGYICLPEILAAGTELDFHFEPTTVREIKRKHGVAVKEAAADCLNSDSTADDDEPTPLAALRKNVTGTIQRGEAEAIAEIPAPHVLAERQQAFLAMPDGYQAGAIISSSWGCEQTNYNYYRITKRSGEWITLIPLKSHSRSTGDMHSDEFPTDTPKDPAKDTDSAWGDREKAIKSPTFRRKLAFGKDGKPIGFTICHGWARLWEGRAGKATHYA